MRRVRIAILGMFFLVVLIVGLIVADSRVSRFGADALLMTKSVHIKFAVQMGLFLLLYTAVSLRVLSGISTKFAVYKLSGYSFFDMGRKVFFDDLLDLTVAFETANFLFFIISLAFGRVGFYRSVLHGVSVEVFVFTGTVILIDVLLGLYFFHRVNLIAHMKRRQRSTKRTRQLPVGKVTRYGFY